MIGPRAENRTVAILWVLLGLFCFRVAAQLIQALAPVSLLPAFDAKMTAAIELLAGLEALEHRRPLRSGPKLEKKIKILRRQVRPLERDRDLSDDIEAVVALISSGALA